ncbi:unnamed protein product [Brassica napus]|uniref:(rape) hypothetical protein n=1 Tax=Brassica napus TaxID=3708 RepID=A0A817B4A0_BRANA|nr:unnamed protein product [Brassica napus]
MGYPPSNIPPTLQWRERRPERRGGTKIAWYLWIKTPPPSPPLERNLAFNDFPLPPVVPSTEEVMNELGEVTVQYTNCDDPRERAATDGVYIIQHNSSCYFKPQRSLNKRECGTNIQP